LALSNVLSIAIMYGSTSFSFTNRLAIVYIVSFAILNAIINVVVAYDKKIRWVHGLLSICGECRRFDQ
jgi:hypothetical protein